MQKNISTKETGFTLIETSLVLLIVFIISGVGYYVYSAQNNTKNSLNNASRANTAIAKPVKDASNDSVKTPVNSEKTPQPASSQNNNPGYLVINEWGVALRIGDKSYSDKLTYRIGKDTYGDDTVYILLKEDVSKNCREVGFALHKSDSPNSKYTKIGNSAYAPSAAPMSMCDKFPNETKAIEILNALSTSINKLDYEVKAAL
jgi:type II secretory pathway pseudopilin PulG